MSVSELNELMTYVVEGWMLFSAGFIGTTFVAFVSKRIQEDMEAAELAQSEKQSEGLIEGLIEGVSAELSESVVEAVEVTAPQSIEAAPSMSPSISSPSISTEGGEENMAVDADEAARLEEVAAVSDKLAKEKQKQSGSSSSVSVST